MPEQMKNYLLVQLRKHIELMNDIYCDTGCDRTLEFEYHNTEAMQIMSMLAVKESENALQSAS